mgnify:CR=1 FL=1
MLETVVKRDRDYGTPARESTQTVTLTIDGQSITVPAGTSVMRAAAEAGINIPKLCAPDSLEAVQTGVQRSLLPVVWDFGLAPILALPAVAVLGLLGLLFLAIFRKRAQKKRPRFGALS